MARSRKRASHRSGTLASRTSGKTSRKALRRSAGIKTLLIARVAGVVGAFVVPEGALDEPLRRDGGLPWAVGRCVGLRGAGGFGLLFLVLGGTPARREGRATGHDLRGDLPVLREARRPSTGRVDAADGARGNHDFVPIVSIRVLPVRVVEPLEDWLDDVHARRAAAVLRPDLAAGLVPGDPPHVRERGRHPITVRAPAQEHLEGLHESRAVREYGPRGRLPGR